MLAVLSSILILGVLSGAEACSATEGSPIQQCVCGIVSAVGDVNWATCKADFMTAAQDYDQATSYFSNGFEEKSADMIKKGLSTFAAGLRATGASLNDCEIGTIAEDLAALAASFDSGVGEIEEGIKIIVKGFDIYDDVYDIVKDYQANQFYDMGKTVYKLIKLLA
jgi:hypothetical protein